MKKQTLIKFIELYQSIEATERSILNEKYIEGCGYVYFEDIHNKFRELYKLFDNNNNGEDYLYIDCALSIIDDDFETFNFDKLSKEERKELTIETETSDGIKHKSLCILKGNQKNYHHCIEKFDSIEAVVEYVLTIN